MKKKATPMKKVAPKKNGYSKAKTAAKTLGGGAGLAVKAINKRKAARAKLLKELG